MDHSKQTTPARKARKYTGFTLVELIVVITILSILGTIGFLSMQGYSSSTRDSNRLADLAGMRKGLELSVVKAGTYPDPSGGVAVTFSGGTVWTQGTVGDSVIQMLSADAFKMKKPTDPLYKGTEYAYSVLNTKREYQVATVLENNTVAYVPMVETAYAADTAQAYVGGNYNGLVAKAVTGSTTYYLALPGIMLSNLSGVELTNAVTQSGNLVLHRKGNIPSTYAGKVAASAPAVTFSAMGNSNFLTSGSGIVALASTGTSLNSSTVNTMMGNLYNTYSGSNLRGDGASASQVTTFISGGNSGPTLTILYNAGMNKSVGGGVVTVPSAIPTFVCGTSTVTGRSPDTTLYKTVTGEDGKCWLASNLGTANIATSFADSAANGWYYQWGRLTDGHQFLTSGTSTAQSSTDSPNHANFILGFSDWRTTPTDSLSTSWG
jgi:prepilin-type N-terminal cleavage/methylation domain-containing protein